METTTALPVLTSIECNTIGAAARAVIGCEASANRDMFEFAVRSITGRGQTVRWFGSTLAVYQERATIAKGASFDVAVSAHGAHGWTLDVYGNIVPVGVSEKDDALVQAAWAHYRGGTRAEGVRAHLQAALSRVAFPALGNGVYYATGGNAVALRGLLREWHKHGAIRAPSVFEVQPSLENVASMVSAARAKFQARSVEIDTMVRATSKEVARADLLREVGEWASAIGLASDALRALCESEEEGHGIDFLASLL